MIDFLRRHRFEWTVYLLLVAVWGHLGLNTISGETKVGGVSITGLTVGIDGCYKNGFLTPATLFIQGDGTESTFLVQLESIDPDGTPTYYEKRGVISDPTQPTDISLLFSSGRENAPLTVRILHPETKAILAERSFAPGENNDDHASVSDEAFRVNFPKPVAGERPIWLTLGGESASLEAMLGSLQLSQDRLPFLLKLKELSNLPETADGLDAVDLIVLNASTPDFYDNGKVPLAAVKTWIHRGGKGAIFGSVKGASLLKPDGILADFVPGTIRPNFESELRTAPSLVQFVPKAKNLVMLGSLDSPYLRFPLLETIADGATTELAEEGVPLLVRGGMGMGTIHYFVADPDESPLADWSGRIGLLMKIFASDVDRLTTTSGESGLIQLGYNDLSGQMRSALDRFDGLRNVPFSMILALIFLFVLVIGPVDWFLTHRIFKKPNSTWITLPIWFLLFGTIAWGIGKSFRPDEIRVNRVDLVDVDLTTGLVRGSTWTGLYSPVDARHNLTLVPILPEAFKPESTPEVRLSWLGLAGSGLGGMSSPIRSIHPWPTGYQIDNAGTLTDFPIQVRSTKPLFGSWFSKVSSPPKMSLINHDGRLSGTIHNPLTESLVNAILLYGERVYLLGTLLPGENEIKSTTPKTDEIGRILTGTTNPFDGRMGNFENAAPWPKYSDVSTDPEAVLRLLSFYQVTGGRKVSGLSDFQHRRLDASELYASGRAVLFAKGRGYNEATTKAATCRTDLMERFDAESSRLFATDAENERGELDRHAVFFRFFIPVERENGDSK